MQPDTLDMDPDFWKEIWGSSRTRTRPRIRRSSTPRAYGSSTLACAGRCFDVLDPLPEDRDWGLTAEHGNAIHEMLTDFIKKSGLYRGDEVRGSVEKYRFSYRIDCLVAMKFGTYDGLIMDGTAGNPREIEEIVPAEFKSCSHWSFEKYIKTPNRAHMLQLMSYLHFHQPSPYPYGKLVLYDKDKDQIATWHVPYDPKLGEEIEHMMEAFRMHIEMGTTPIATSDQGNCKYCPYVKRCADLAKEAVPSPK